MRFHWFLFIIIALTSCRSDKITPGCVDFETEILPVMVNKCGNVGCHNSSSKEEGYDFTYYEGILEAVKAQKSNSSKVMRVIRSGGMPPKGSPQLTEDEKQKIALWIDLGAKKESCNITQNCDTLNVTYDNSIKQIMETYCIGCHSTGSPSAGHDLQTYQGVKNSALSGRLLGSILWEDGFTAMPNGSPTKLPSCEIQKIQSWINSGFPQ